MIRDIHKSGVADPNRKSRSMCPSPLDITENYIEHTVSPMTLDAESSTSAEHMSIITMPDKVKQPQS